MRRLSELAPLALALACAAPAPRYAPFDPLSGEPVPTPIVRDGRTLFLGVVPKGYAPTDGRLSPPMIEFLHREVYGGEASLSVERYVEKNGAPTLEAFTRSLHPERPQPVPRSFRGKTLSVYHDLRFESYARRIPPNDPYADSLGSAIRPPKLDPFGKRRFPKGGDAYRLHRCKKVGAWRILGAQARLRLKRERGDTAPPPMTPRERKILGACFGRVVVERLRAGESYGSIPKPSLSRLRLMAKDEWEHGSARRVDRECVHLRRLDDGFAAVRFRAPDHAFEDQHPAWELFLGSLIFEADLGAGP